MNTDEIKRRMMPEINVPSLLFKELLQTIKSPKFNAETIFDLNDDLLPRFRFIRHDCFYFTVRELFLFIRKL